MKDIKLSRRIKAVFSLAAAIVMPAFLFFVYYFTTDAGKAMSLAISISFSLVYILALMLTVKMPETDKISGFVIVVLGMAALVFARTCMVYYRSGDYNSFLIHWVEQMRNMSVFDALSTPIGDYNVPYLYLLLIISRIPANDLILIKAASCIFDILLCYAVALIARKITKSESATVLSFVLTAAIPTVFLNGSMWGQCDSIYAFFAVMTLYYALSGKGGRAMLFYSFAFSFKLQAIFLAPAIIICLFIKRIKPLHLIWFPVGFIATALPALLGGRSIYNTFSIYFRQTGTYTSLNLNVPTVFRFVSNVNDSMFTMAGVMLAGIVCLAILYLGFRVREKIDDKALVIFFFISALAIPYFLPRMHDRYYYLADVLSVVYYLADRKKWYVPLVTVFSSFTAYAYYLFNGITLINYVYLSIALLVIIIITAKDIYIKTRINQGETI